MGWRAPLPIEQPTWTDRAGDAAPKGLIPEDASWGGWVVEMSPATDKHGWQYGTHFSHLGSPRIGGRASQRSTDFVRRRKWLLHDAAKRRAAQRNVAWLTSEHMLQSESQERRETSAALGAARAFVGLFSDLLSRNNLWTMLPWDPFSYSVVYERHTSYLARVRELLLPNRLQSAASPAAAPAPSATAPSAPGGRPPAAGSAAFSVTEGAGTGGGDGAARATRAPVALDDALLNDMQASVDFSRAAYGYAFLTGGMSSVLAYLHMQTLQRSYFDIISGASKEANNQAVSFITGIPTSDILVAHWNNSTYRPCHFLAVDRKRRRLVMAIRGSLEVGDLLTDLHAKPIDLSMAGVHCHVHEGMLRAATYLHCYTGQAVKDAHDAFPDYPLFLTGHSLGGGVATLLTLLLRQSGGAPERLQKNGISCMSLAPAACLSTNLAQHCSPFVTSLVLSSDAIPRLSYYTVEALLREISGASPAKRTVGEIQSTLSAAFAPLQRLANLQAPSATNGNGSGRGKQQTAPLRFPDSPDSATLASRESERIREPLDPRVDPLARAPRPRNAAEVAAAEFPAPVLATAPSVAPELERPLRGGAAAAPPRGVVGSSVDGEFDGVRRENGTRGDGGKRQKTDAGIGAGGRTQAIDAQADGAAGVDRSEDGVGQSPALGGTSAAGWGQLSFAPFRWLWGGGARNGERRASNPRHQQPSPLLASPSSAPQLHGKNGGRPDRAPPGRNGGPDRAPDAADEGQLSASGAAAIGDGGRAPARPSSPNSPLFKASDPESSDAFDAERGSGADARPAEPPLEPDDDPHEYLRKRGLIPATKAASEDGSSDARGDAGAAGGGPSPFSVQHMSGKDKRLLEELDKARLARERSGEPIPPLFPAGRVLWLLPLKRDPAAAPGAPAALASASAIASNPLRLDAQAADNLDAAVQQASMDTEAVSPPPDAVATPAREAGGAAATLTRDGSAEAAAAQSRDEMLPDSMPREARGMIERWSLSMDGGEPSAAGGATPEGRSGGSRAGAAAGGGDVGAAGGSGAAPDDGNATLGKRRGSGGPWASVAGSFSKLFRGEGGGPADGAWDPSVAPGGAVVGVDGSFDNVSTTDAHSFRIEDSSGRCAGGEAVDVAVVDVSDARSVFNYLTLTPDMMNDHLPDSYTRAINAIRHKCLRRKSSGRA